MKKLLVVLAILTVSALYSQHTIPITPEQAKLAIRNAQKVEVLTEQLQIQELMMENQTESMELLRRQLSAAELKFSLLQSNYNIVNTQYQIEKETKKKGKWLQKALIITGTFGLGYLVGSSL